MFLVPMAVQQARAQSRQRRILDAALRVFSRSPYHDASMDQIAMEARTSKGGVYFHFPSKEAVFLALLDRTAERLMDKIDSATAVFADPVARADAALLTVLRTFSRHRALARLFMIEALGAGREFHRRMAEIRAEFAMEIRRHLDTAVEAGLIDAIDTETASRAWFGAVNEVITHWVLAERPDRLEDTYESLRPLLMRGVGAVTDGQARKRPPSAPLTAPRSDRGARRG